MEKVVKIEKLDNFGRGIAYLDDKIVFVKDALVGEEVSIEITNIKKKYMEANVLRYISKSPIRIDAICPYFNKCGGCDLLHMSYDNQTIYKYNKVKDIMLKYANLACVENILFSDKVLYYRNKVTFKVEGIVGLYQKKSYNIIPIDKCYLIDNRINDYLKLIKTIDLIGVNEIVIRTSFKETMIIFKCDKMVNIDTSIFDCNIIMEVDNKEIVLKGKDYIIEKLGNKDYKISPSSFFQVNSSQALKLYDLVKKELDGNVNDNVLDLYCGTGTIGIYVADNVKEVMGIEINRDAIKDATQNATMNNITNASFIAGDVETSLKKVGFKPTKIIVDPPRAGLDNKVINDILEMGAEKVIYVSCDPVTLARDLKLLSSKYEVKKIIPVDMFPNTYHVECVSVLELIIGGCK